MKTMDLTKGSIWKQLLIFFVPIAIGTFFQILYNTVDALIVGNFLGAEGLASVSGSNEFLIKLLVGFLTGISTGAGVIVSKYWGSREYGKAGAIVKAGLGVSVLGGLCMILGMHWSAPTVLRIMDTPQELMEGTLLYLRIYLLGLIPMFLYNMGAAILRAIGDSKLPLYLLIVSSLANVVLDLLLIVALDMGIAGAAAATSLSQLISAVLILYFLKKRMGRYTTGEKADHELIRKMGQILAIGVPIGVQSITFNLSNLVIQSKVNYLGTTTMAGWSVFGKVDGIFWMLTSSLGMSITTFVGQNFGANRLDRVKKCVHTGLAMDLGMTLVFGTLFMSFRYPLVSLFSQDAAVIEEAASQMQRMIPYYILFPILEVLPAVIRGTGDTVKPTIIMFFSITFLRIVWLMVRFAQVPDMQTVILSYPISWITATVFMVAYYLRMPWRKAA